MLLELYPTIASLTESTRPSTVNQISELPTTILKVLKYLTKNMLLFDLF
jgi:hypothetical protein